MPDDVMTGHNSPPATDAILLNLDGRHGGLLNRRDDLIKSLGRVPSVIQTDEIEQKATDYIKQCKGAIKSANAARVAEKEPFLEGGRAVDGFFTKIKTPLEDAATTVNGLVTTYKQKKAAEERRVREAAEKRLQAEADEAARIAAEAERKIQDETDLENAVAAEVRQEVAKNAAAAARADANAKAADLSRSRSDLGTVSSLTTRWVHDEAALSRETIDLEALRQHLPANALNQAVRSFIKAGGRELKGARIFEKTENVVR